MSSLIEVIVLDEDGEQLATAKIHVQYGNERQKVIVFLADPDTEWVDMTYRDILNQSMAEQLSMVEGYDA